MAATARLRLLRNEEPVRVSIWRKASSKVTSSPAGRLVSTMCVSWCACSKAHRISFCSVAAACSPGPLSRNSAMPSTILCEVDGMAEFLERGPGEHAAIGVDVGGPSFDYETTLDARTCVLLGRRLASGGRVAVNIARDRARDTTLVRI